MLKGEGDDSLVLVYDMSIAEQIGMVLNGDMPHSGQAWVWLVGDDGPRSSAQPLP